MKAAGEALCLTSPEAGLAVVTGFVCDRAETAAPIAKHASAASNRMRAYFNIFIVSLKLGRVNDCRPMPIPGCMSRPCPVQRERLSRAFQPGRASLFQPGTSVPPASRVWRLQAMRSPIYAVSPRLGAYRVTNTDDELIDYPLSAARERPKTSVPHRFAIYANALRICDPPRARVIRTPSGDAMDCV